MSCDAEFKKKRHLLSHLIHFAVNSLSLVLMKWTCSVLLKSCVNLCNLMSAVNKPDTKLLIYVFVKIVILCKVRFFSVKKSVGRAVKCWTRQTLPSFLSYISLVVCKFEWERFQKFIKADRKFGLLCLYFSGDYEEDKSRDYKEGCKENRFSKLFNFTSRRIDLNGHFLPFRKI